MKKFLQILSLVSFYFCNLYADTNEFTVKGDTIFFNKTLKDWCESGYGETLFNEQTNYRKLFINGEEVKGDIIIPEGTRNIRENSFYNLNITSVSFPSSLDSILFKAFYNCPIKEIYFPDSIKCIAYDAFAPDFEESGSPKKINKITYHNSNAKVVWSAFPKTLIDTQYFIGTIKEWCELRAASHGYMYDTGAYWDYTGIKYVKKLFINETEITDNINITIPEGTPIGPLLGFEFDTIFAHEKKTTDFYYENIHNCNDSNSYSEAWYSFEQHKYIDIYHKHNKYDEDDIKYKFNVLVINDTIKLERVIINDIAYMLNYENKTAIVEHKRANEKCYSGTITIPENVQKNNISFTVNQIAKNSLCSNINHINYYDDYIDEIKLPTTITDIYDNCWHYVKKINVTNQSSLKHIERDNGAEIMQKLYLNNKKVDAAMVLKEQTGSTSFKEVAVHIDSMYYVLETFQLLYSHNWVNDIDVIIIKGKCDTAKTHYIFDNFIRVTNQDLKLKTIYTSCYSETPNFFFPDHPIEDSSASNKYELINFKKADFVSSDNGITILKDCEGNEIILGIKDTTANKSDSSNINVKPEFNDAEFCWPITENTQTYILTITIEGKTFCSLRFDSNGRLVNIDFSGLRSSNSSTGNKFSFTVTGLKENTNYGYIMSAIGHENEVLKEYTGTFKTKSANSSSTLVSNTNIKFNIIGKEIIFLTKEKVTIHDTNGRQIFANDNKDRHTFKKPGVYIITTKNKPQKIVIE